MFTAQEFIKRRKSIVKQMPDNSAIILEANEPTFKNSDTEHIFRQDSNFYYLTGIEESDITLILTKVDKTVHEFLFTEKNNEHNVVWIGSRLEIDELKDRTGVERVLYNDQLSMYEKSILSSIENLYYDYESFAEPQYNRKLIKLNEIKAHYPNIRSVKNAQQLLFKSRIIKSSSEVKALQKAIDITAEAVLRAYKFTKPGMFEYEVRAEIEYAYLKNGSRMPGFPSIVAAGENATVLHYVTMDTLIKKNDLVLIDIGADYMNYSADISRTYPASGTFKGKQKDLYAALLDVQKKIIHYAKPGRSMKDVNKKTTVLIGKMLKSFKYIKDESQFFKYYPHSVGHMLGLDTHDVQGKKRQQPILKKGMIITIEPGVYIKEDNIGIRIEDDILINDKGNVNLSAGIPKEIKEIEKIMGA